MEMVFERLIPGMQDGDDPDGSLQTGAAKLQQGLTDGFKEQAEENLFVGENQAVENVGQGKHQVKISHRQKLRGLFLQPLGFGQRLVRLRRSGYGRSYKSGAQSRKRRTA
jgi:hypothetical protein